MTISAPWSSNQRASATVVAEDITRQPADLMRASSDGAGRPKWKLTTSGRAVSTTWHIESSNGGTWTGGAVPSASLRNSRQYGSSRRRQASSRPGPAGAEVWQKKFTLIGRTVRARNWAIASRAASGDSPAQPMEPSPPAAQTDAASSAARCQNRERWCCRPPVASTRIPNRSVGRRQAGL